MLTLTKQHAESSLTNTDARFELAFQRVYKLETLLGELQNSLFSLEEANLRHAESAKHASVAAAGAVEALDLGQQLEKRCHELESRVTDVTSGLKDVSVTVNRDMNKSETLYNALSNRLDHVYAVQEDANGKVDKRIDVLSQRLEMAEAALEEDFKSRNTTSAARDDDDGEEGSTRGKGGRRRKRSRKPGMQTSTDQDHSGDDDGDDGAKLEDVRKVGRDQADVAVASLLPTLLFHVKPMLDPLLRAHTEELASGLMKHQLGLGTKVEQLRGSVNSLFERVREVEGKVVVYKTEKEEGAASSSSSSSSSSVSTSTSSLGGSATNPTSTSKSMNGSISNTHNNSSVSSSSSISNDDVTALRNEVQEISRSHTSFKSHVTSQLNETRVALDKTSEDIRLMQMQSKRAHSQLVSTLASLQDAVTMIREGTETNASAVAALAEMQQHHQQQQALLHRQQQHQPQQQQQQQQQQLQAGATGSEAGREGGGGGGGGGGGCESVPLSLSRMSSFVPPPLSSTSSASGDSLSGDKDLFKRASSSSSSSRPSSRMCQGHGNISSGSGNGSRAGTPRMSPSSSASGQCHPITAPLPENEVLLPSSSTSTTSSSSVASLRVPMESQDAAPIVVKISSLSPPSPSQTDISGHPQKISSSGLLNLPVVPPVPSLPFVPPSSSPSSSSPASALLDACTTGNGDGAATVGGSNVARSVVGGNSVDSAASVEVNDNTVSSEYHNRHSQADDIHIDAATEHENDEENDEEKEEDEKEEEEDEEEDEDKTMVTRAQLRSIVGSIEAVLSDLRSSISALHDASMEQVGSVKDDVDAALASMVSVQTRSNQAWKTAFHILENEQTRLSAALTELSTSTSTSTGKIAADVSSLQSSQLVLEDKVKHLQEQVTTYDTALTNVTEGVQSLDDVLSQRMSAVDARVVDVEIGVSTIEKRILHVVDDVKAIVTTSTSTSTSSLSVAKEAVATAVDQITRTLLQPLNNRVEKVETDVSAFHESSQRMQAKQTDAIVQLEKDVTMEMSRLDNCLRDVESSQSKKKVITELPVEIRASLLAEAAMEAKSIALDLSGKTVDAASSAIAAEIDDLKSTLLQEQMDFKSQMVKEQSDFKSHLEHDRNQLFASSRMFQEQVAVSVQDIRTNVGKVHARVEQLENKMSHVEEKLGEVAAVTSNLPADMLSRVTSVESFAQDIDNAVTDLSSRVTTRITAAETALAKGLTTLSRVAAECDEGLVDVRRRVAVCVRGVNYLLPGTITMTADGIQLVDSAVTRVTPAGLTAVTDAGLVSTSTSTSAAPQPVMVTGSFDRVNLSGRASGGNHESVTSTYSSSSSSGSASGFGGGAVGGGGIGRGGREGGLVDTDGASTV